MADELILAAAAADDIDEVIRLLMEDKADVNIQDANGQTPLHKAAQTGSVRMLRALLTAGAIVDPREIASVGGATPLVLAVRADHLECVDVLADAGADVNVRSSLDNTTPLHDACARGLSAMIKYLISRGGDVGVRDIRGYNPSQHAAISGYKELTFIAGMPPPASPMAEEVLAYQAFRQQQYALLTGTEKKKPAAVGTKKKK